MCDDAVSLRVEVWQSMLSGFDKLGFDKLGFDKLGFDKLSRRGAKPDVFIACGLQRPASRIDSCFRAAHGSADKQLQKPSSSKKSCRWHETKH